MLHFTVQMGVKLLETALEHMYLGVYFSDAANIKVVVALHRVDHFLDLLGMVIEVGPCARLCLVRIDERAAGTVRGSRKYQILGEIHRLGLLLWAIDDLCFISWCSLLSGGHVIDVCGKLNTEKE